MRCITINFGPKDKDLLSWVSLLAEGQFSRYIRSALYAHLRGEELQLGTVTINTDQKPIRKPLYISESDPDLLIWADGIPNRKLGSVIKTILRKFIVFRVMVEGEGDFIPAFLPPNGRYQLISKATGEVISNANIPVTAPEPPREVKEEDQGVEVGNTPQTTVVEESDKKAEQVQPVMAGERVLDDKDRSRLMFLSSLSSKAVVTKPIDETTEPSEDM